MILTENEKNIIADTDFLPSKIVVMDKIRSLFSEVRQELRNTINESGFIYPVETDIANGKIFKGENYNSLPYVILDYPKLYSSTSTFTFRTMFYWGCFFSATIHISGESLNKYRTAIKKNISSLLDDQIYFCVNDNPWEYHYEKSNYVLLNNKKIGLIEKRDFIKLSKKFDLEQYKILPYLVDNYYQTILKLLSLTLND